MTSGYRHKLLNWFISMLLTITTFTLSVSIFWFYKMPQHIGDPHPDAFIGPLGSSLGIFATYLFLFGIWHSLDFFENPLPRSGWKKRLIDYASVCLLLTATMFISLMIQAGIFENESCLEVNGDDFYCIVRPSLWLLYPWWGGVGLALILCIAKGANAINSRLTKAQ